MTDLKDVLMRLGLSQYYEPFVNEGFDTWDTLMDITESDLEILGVKLGHRRKLQRAILNASKDRLPSAIHAVAGSTQDSFWEEESRGQQQQQRPQQQQHQQPPPPLQQDGQHSQNTQQSQQHQGQRQDNSGANNSEQPRSKRKYRRHPKPDEFAPERPPSAYVVFSNQIRDKLKGRDLSFTEIAKLVGERWQELDAQEKEPCEREAQALKDKYYTELREYKKTPQYQSYQEYLADFKAKHSDQAQNQGQRQGQGQGQENKKPKLQHTSSSLRNRDQASRASPSVIESLADGASNAGQRPPSDSPTSTQNSPAYSSPSTDTFRRFPAPQVNSDDGTASSHSAWRPGPPLTLFQRYASITASQPVNQSEDGSLSPSTQNNFTTTRTVASSVSSMPSLTQPDTASSRSSERSLLNWPLHTTLPPMSSTGIGRTLPKHTSLSSGLKSYNPPPPPPPPPFRPSSPNSASTAKTSLSTLLRATEHVEREPNVKKSPARK